LHQKVPEEETSSWVLYPLAELEEVEEDLVGWYLA